MFQIEVAGLVIRIENRYPDVRELCRDYITGDDRKADICVSVSEEELQTEIDKAPEYFFGKGYAEGVVVYEKISNALPAFDAFVMHGSVVEVDGGAYAFSAESGTGKTTHTRYWKEVLKNRVSVINGDKTILRFNAEFCDRCYQKSGKTFDSCSMATVPQIEDLDSCSTIQNSELSDSTGENPSNALSSDTLLAYGTPWCGKEGWNTNTCAPLKALCLLERGEKNEVFPIDAFEHLGELMGHFHLPGNGQVDMLKLMQLIDRMVNIVPVYRLRCTNDISAAETAIKYLGL